MITIERLGKGRKLIVFDRDENGKRYSTIIKDFKPYFYVKDENGDKISLFGEKVKKIIVDSPDEVPILREKYDKTYESNIVFTQRFLIDRYDIPIKKKKLRINYLDIETKDSFNINALQPILCLTCYDNFLEKYITFVWREDFDTKTTKDGIHSYYYFDNELNMMNKFIEFIQSTDPDIICGWNIGFDLSYIINRCKKLKLQVEKISPINFILIDEKYKDVKIFGRVVLDLLDGYRRFFTNQKYESYSLEFIGNLELGEGKIKLNKSFENLWKENIELLLEYNINDVRLIKKLDDKLNIIDFFDEIRRELGVLWDKVKSVSSLNNTAILRKAKELGIVIPFIKEREIETIKGAEVFNPVYGLHNNVVMLDVTSLYPTVLVSCNMSPETIETWGEIRLGNGIAFTNKKEGFIPKIVNEQFKLRIKYKNLMLNEKPGTDRYQEYYSKQYTYKVLLNSWYGILNSHYCILQDRRISDSITWLGREIIKWGKQKAEELGYIVLYGDTDALLIKVGDNLTNNEVIEEGKKLSYQLSQSFLELIKKYGIEKNLFHLKFEKIFCRFFLQKDTKKRYVGYLSWIEGKEVANKMTVVGFEIRRSDSSKVSKDFQKEFFKMILDGKRKEEINEYINKIIKDIKEGKYIIQDLGIPKSINQRLTEYKSKTAHMRAAEYSNKYLKTSFGQGSKIRFVYVKRMPEGIASTDVIAFDNDTKLPEGIEIDYDKMLPVIISNKVERAYEALGWDSKTQSESLNKWM